ncbi:hypothetical protein DFQ30_004910, partial [Apophysomyces sp. BC1015]
GQQPQHADNHGERIVVDVAGLQEADHSGKLCDRARAAVDQTVDHDDIALLPESFAECHRAVGKHDLVDLVHVVLVVQQRVEGGEALANRRRDVRPLQAGHGVQRHRQPAVERVGHLAQRLVVLADVDDLVEHDAVREKIAEDHRSDRDRANHQQHQRQRDDPRRLVRLMRAMAMVVVVAVAMIIMMHVAEALRTMEHHEVHAERVQCGHEHADGHRE